MSEKKWANISPKDGSNVLIAVHPTYGAELVPPEQYQAYTDGMLEEWASDQYSERVLVQGSPTDGLLLQMTGVDPDHIIYEFPDEPGTPIFGNATVIGSTARGENDTAPGCVDLVAERLQTSGYCNDVRIPSHATLTPSRKP